METHRGTGYAAAPTALLTVNTAASTLAVSRRTIYRLVSQGALPAVRVGERLRFRPQEIDAYLERNREAGDP
jgi:excisionase family DNA binding protein